MNAIWTVQNIFAFFKFPVTEIANLIDPQGGKQNQEEKAWAEAFISFQRVFIVTLFTLILI